MPKASSTEENNAPIKRAPRKRAVRRVVSSDEAPVRKVRSVPAPALAIRKAPVRLETVVEKKSSAKLYGAVFGILLLVLLGAFWLGISDVGQIDVNAKITERNQKQADDAAIADGTYDETGENNTVVIPVQNSAPTVPNAGFRGRGVGTPAVVTETPPVEEVATSTATATEEMASDSGEVSAVEAETDLEVDSPQLSD